MVLSSNGLRGDDVIHEIWTYNLWDETWKEWMNFPTAKAKQFPTTTGQCGVAIGSNIYMFGGEKLSTLLWKITRNTDGSFDWSAIHLGTNHSKIPSPRSYSCGWEYANKLWIFGGYGRSQHHFLHNHGKFELGPGHTGRHWKNNQLLCYDPSIQTWNDVGCSGKIPLPRYAASSALIKDKIWMYGGKTFGPENELYYLNMNSLSWTLIWPLIPQIWPPVVAAASLTPVADSQLVLHGGTSETGSSWIFDVKSRSWSRHLATDDHDCHHSTGTTGLNGYVVVVGGIRWSPWSHAYSPVFCVMLEPKSLQQLAVRAIHQHETPLNLKCLLPSSLRQKIISAYD